jgi:hypothetical protein
VFPPHPLEEEKRIKGKWNCRREWRGVGRLTEFEKSRRWGSLGNGESRSGL